MVLKHIADANARNVSRSPESLRDALLRDTLARAADSDNDSLQTVLNNLLTYVEVVHPQNHSVGLMQCQSMQLKHEASDVEIMFSRWTLSYHDHAADVEFGR